MQYVEATISYMNMYIIDRPGGLRKATDFLAKRTMAEFYSACMY
jgi:hypothetical protein